MKKDIEWLKEAVGELNLVDTVFEADGVSYIDTAVSVTQVYDLIDQLDEPEALSKEWIDNNVVHVRGLGDIIEAVAVENLLVPKQELPVIPKYVAEWITKHRDTFDLYPMLKRLEKNSSKLELTYKWYRTNTHEFVSAYLTGEYEVEEEPLYRALIKGHELIDSAKSYWCFNMSNDRVFINNLYSMYNNFITEMTKAEWNKVGINDSNAHFVKVKEVEK